MLWLRSELHPLEEADEEAGSGVSADLGAQVCSVDSQRLLALGVL